MRYILFISMLFYSAGCVNNSLMLVAEEGRYKDYTYTIPFEISAKSKKDTLVDLGVIYEGMPAADLKLYGFGKENLVRSYRSDNNRYLVFPKKNNPVKTIVFVLERERIIDWFEAKR